MNRVITEGTRCREDLQIKNRLTDLKKAAYGIGWGYGDDVPVTIGDLELHFRERGKR
jgi:hypothetical protein